jgi:hypothetical protein
MMEDVKPILYSGDINEHIPIEEWVYRKNITEEIPHYLIEDKNTETVIVSFGGMGIDPNGESQYALVSTLEKENISTIYLRDQTNAWYFNGVRGLSNDVTSTVSGINDLLSKIKHTKTIFFGVSAGGFAAILYGVLCNADLVVTVNPQTLLQKGVECFAHGNLYKLKWCNDNDIIYRDLLNLTVPEKTKIEIYYGKDEPVDIFHSTRMKDVDNVSLHPEQGTHGTVAPILRDGKKLKTILRI